MLEVAGKIDLGINRNLLTRCDSRKNRLKDSGVIIRKSDTHPHIHAEHDEAD